MYHIVPGKCPYPPGQHPPGQHPPGQHPPGQHPPPNFDSFVVLRGLLCNHHHTKFCVVNPKVGLLSSHSCDCSDALWAPRHQASKVCTHPSVVSFTAFLPCNTKFAHCKRRPNAAETWQQGYESVLFVARYSLLHCWAGLDEAQMK